VRIAEIKIELDQDEQFDVTKVSGGVVERFRATQVWRYVYRKYDRTDFGFLLSTHGPQIRKDGSLSTRRRGGVSLHGPGTDPEITANLKAMPPALWDKLVAVGFFDEPGDEG
jgi:hypothetical protein